MDLQLNRADETMSMSVEKSTIDRLIVIYADVDENFYFRFHDGFISVEEFFEYLVPALACTNWPFDKREVSRIWHQVVLVPTGRRPEEFRGILPKPRCNAECIQVPNKAAYDDGGRREPINTPSSSTISREDPCYLGKPTHEVQISTLWNEWYMSSDSYFKRYWIAKESKLTSLFLSQSDVGETNVRYSLTMMPHYHNEGSSVDEKLLRMVALARKKKITCRASHVVGPDMIISVLVWNCKGVQLCILKEMIDTILRTENPMMLVVTETQVSREDAYVACRNLGFRGVACADPSGSRGDRKPDGVTEWDNVLRKGMSSGINGKYVGKVKMELVQLKKRRQVTASNNHVVD